MVGDSNVNRNLDSAKATNPSNVFICFSIGLLAHLFWLFQFWPPGGVASVHFVLVT